VQFIVSTHSPLVAQAADANGIFVLPSQDEAERKPRRLDAHEVQKIKLKQAEKTLLGTAFGLTTTRSQWAMDQIEKWKRLNAKKQADIPLSPGETKALRELKVQMDIAFEQNEAT
jgi:predicted ATP-binding protein involved in virulence